MLEILFRPSYVNDGKKMILWHNASLLGGDVSGR